MSRELSSNWPLRFALFLWALGIETFARRHDRTVAFVATEHGVLAAAAWSVALGTTVAAVVALCLSKHRRLATGAFVVFASAFIVSFAFRAVNGAGFTVTTARLVTAGGGYAKEAFFFHGVRAAAYAFFGFVMLHVPRFAASRFGVPRVGTLPTFVCLVVLLVSGAGGILAQVPSWLPSFLAPTAFVEAAVHRPDAVARKPVSLPLPGPALARHVVLVIDESVRGDLLSLSRVETSTTPWLASQRDMLADFGVASSLTNCSASANAGLIAGLGRADLPDRTNAVRTNATLFEHAARAGYRTALVDAQSNSLAPPWALTARDVAAIDVRHVLRREHPEVAPPFIDRELADAVVELTADGRPTFVYASKRGAHYRYTNGVPESSRSESVPQAIALGFREESREAAQYLDALSYSVDVFFVDLLKRLEGRDVLVVYVSDHGESLLEDGSTRTHCAEGPAPPEQGRVPLLLWMGDPSGDAFARLRTSAAALRDQVDAVRIFPTLLVAFGYEEAEVRRRHGPSLFDRDGAGAPGRFFSGDMAGKGPFWSNRIR